MIRITILIVAVVVGAFMFLPETVAMYPDTDGVVDAISTDIGNIRDSVIDSVKSTLTDAITSVTDSVSDKVRNTLG